MSNIIDKIQVSGVTYDIGGSGGGKAIEGGRGISVTTGETADTVSFNLPISAGTNNLDNITCCGSNTVSGQYAVAFGNGNTSKGGASLTFGRNCSTYNYDNVAGGFGVTTRGNQASSFGQYTKTVNEAEHSVGRYNVSNKANGTFGDSGNTLFSVGNGTADNARHNAFEIRQNGDIYLSSGGTDIKLQDHLGGGSGGGISSAECQTMIDENISGKTDNTTFTAYTASTDTAIQGKQDTLVSGTNIKTINNESILGSGNITIQGGGGNPTVELTQAEYDALVTAGTVSADTFYVITDAQAGDLTNYYTKTEVDNAITAATSTKQDTLVSGTNIKTINNTSLLGSGNIDIQGGGGKAIEAGRGISITTGETADTVSFNLPISAGTGTNALIFASDTYDLSNRASGNYSVSLNGGGYHATYAKGVCSVAEGMDTYAYQSGCHAEGHSTKAGNPSVYFSMYAHAEGDATYAYGQTSHSEGYGTTAATDSSHAEGRFTVTKNNAEHASGQYNNSVSASTTFGDSGNTLFSVGNGTSTSARHNAFEIRQNGDIYCSDGTNDVKLQDTITATAANTTALGGLSLVKLTQAEYDALATKDNSTLYVIVN